MCDFDVKDLRERKIKRDRQRKRRKTKCNNIRCDLFVSMRLFLFHDLNKQIGVYIFELKFIGVKRKSKSKFKRKPYFFLFLFILWFFISMGQRKNEYTCNEKGKKGTHTQHTPAKFNEKIKHSEIAYVCDWSHSATTTGIFNAWIVIIYQ